MMVCATAESTFTLCTVKTEIGSQPRSSGHCRVVCISACGNKTALFTKVFNQITGRLQSGRGLHELELLPQRWTIYDFY
jgi:hypothetical protein